VPAATTAACERFAPVRPGGNVLHTTQNRLREKSFLKSAGIPVTPFWPVRSHEELAAAVRQSGLPAVLKTADWGYDGKGQIKLNSLADLDDAWTSLGAGEAIVEAFIDFQCEVSVVAARGQDGSLVTYGPVHNVHQNHILDTTRALAGVSPAVAQRAVDIAREILERLEVVGVLCVEFFVDRRDQLMVNELAPRPHNSGHYTIDACTTCQFEQQVRAICGLPLGSPRQHRPAAMANLLGDRWQAGPPNWSAALASGDVKLHLYGKTEPRRGRKMGHLTALGDSADEALARALAARNALAPAGSSR
jgi:5-(carboxyamino)imidazole ribonucleotide synthase